MRLSQSNGRAHRAHGKDRARRTAAQRAAEVDVMTDEQYIDELFAREVVGMDTPGFRDFVLDLMGMIGERPRAGDVCSMYLAYKAGMEVGAAKVLPEAKRIEREAKERAEKRKKRK